MLFNFIKTTGLSLLLGLFALVFAQTPDASIKPTYFAGDVASLDAKSLTITTKTGQTEVVLTEKTVYKKASAEDFNLAAATPGVCD